MLRPRQLRLLLRVALGRLLLCAKLRGRGGSLCQTNKHLRVSNEQHKSGRTETAENETVTPLNDNDSFGDSQQAHTQGESSD